MISAIDVPKSGWHVTRLGAPLIAVAKAINGLRQLKFKASDKWAFTWDEGGAVIEYVPTSDVEDSSALLPWTPYPSPTATGPNAPFTLRIVPGTVTDGAKLWTAARENIEIIVPANTKLYVWGEAGIAATARITAFDYNYAAALPAAVALTSDGTPPPLARQLLFIVSSNATGLELPAIAQECNTPLSLYPKTISQTTAGSTVVMDWQPTNPNLLG